MAKGSTFQTMGAPMSMVEEFKAFVMRGNVVDLAVGVIIGSAFGKIVSSLVENILMPIIGLATGGIDFSKMNLKLGSAADSVVWKYGVFLQSVFDFLIVAFCIFMMVKAINSMKKPKPAVADAVAPPPSASEVYLKEIRDALIKR
jgi:large conductance mechanosensitive channel